MESYNAVTILASVDTSENTIPIYAQFIVTQTVAQSEAIVATALELPLWSMSPGKNLIIRLRRYGQEIAHWEYETSQTNQAVIAHLPLASPYLLDGNLEVEVAGVTITHEDKDAAPRVFIDTADSYYPAGNFRIAQNEKIGDMALTIIATRSRWQRLWQEWRADPLTGVIMLGNGILLLMFIAAIPGAGQRLWRHYFGKLVVD